MWPAAGGAAGAGIGMLAGPGGAIAGAAIGAGAVHVIGENNELRDGSLTGERAKDKEIQRIRYVNVPEPFIPGWIKLTALALVALWLLKFIGPRYREQFFAMLKNLIKLRLPTAIKHAAMASGAMHTEKK